MPKPAACYARRLVFARRTRVRARRRTRRYLEHPSPHRCRVQRSESSQFRVRSRESVRFSGQVRTSGASAERPALATHPRARADRGPRLRPAPAPEWRNERSRHRSDRPVHAPCLIGPGDPRGARKNRQCRRRFVQGTRPVSAEQWPWDPRRSRSRIGRLGPRASHPTDPLSDSMGLLGAATTPRRLVPELELLE